MSKNQKTTLFANSFYIWLMELAHISVFLIVAFTLLFLATILLNSETVEQYSLIVKSSIMIFVYLGIISGAIKAFSKIFKQKEYISKLNVLNVFLLQLIVFGIYSYLCFYFKLHVIFFVGMYISLFVQIFINTIAIKLNNRKYPKQIPNATSETATTKSSAKHSKTSKIVNTLEVKDTAIEPEIENTNSSASENNIIDWNKINGKK